LEGRLLRLTLNRPDKRNALNTETCRQLVDAVEAAQNDDSTGAILIDAEGSAFCSGMDLDEAARVDAVQLTNIHVKLFSMGMWSVKPIVAAVQGGAYAGGMGLVANAHVVFAADDASFGLPEIKIGMWPFVIWRSLVMSVGERRAMELTLTGRKITAQQAAAWGLVHYVTQPSMLSTSSFDLAKTLSEASSPTIHRGFALAREARGLGMDEALALAVRLRAEQMASPDFHEGVKASKEKRAPVWPSAE
jgi:enoyl-CoA hydratase/carnithine racemase